MCSSGGVTQCGNVRQVRLLTMWIVKACSLPYFLDWPVQFALRHLHSLWGMEWITSSIFLIVLVIDIKQDLGRNTHLTDIYFVVITVWMVIFLFPVKWHYSSEPNYWCYQSEKGAFNGVLKKARQKAYYLLNMFNVNHILQAGWQYRPLV